VQKQERRGQGTSGTGESICLVKSNGACLSDCVAIYSLASGLSPFFLPFPSFTMARRKSSKAPAQAAGSSPSSPTPTAASNTADPNPSFLRAAGRFLSTVSSSLLSYLLRFLQLVHFLLTFGWLPRSSDQQEQPRPQPEVQEQYQQRNKRQPDVDTTKQSNPTKEEKKITPPNISPSRRAIIIHDPTVSKPPPSTMQRPPRSQNENAKPGTSCDASANLGAQFEKPDLEGRNADVPPQMLPQPVIPLKPVPPPNLVTVEKGVHQDAEDAAQEAEKKVHRAFMAEALDMVGCLTCPSRLIRPFSFAANHALHTAYHCL